MSINLGLMGFALPLALIAHRMYKIGVEQGHKDAKEKLEELE